MLHKKIWKESPNFISATTSRQNQLHGKITENRRQTPPVFTPTTAHLHPCTLLLIWRRRKARPKVEWNRRGLFVSYVSKQATGRKLHPKDRFWSDTANCHISYRLTCSQHNEKKKCLSVRAKFHCQVRLTYFGWRENNKQQ